MLKRKTLNEYLEETSAKFPLWGTAVTPLSVCNEEFQQALTNYIYDTYDDYILRKTISKFDTIEDITRRIQTVCDALYYAHDYTYTHLSASLKLEYEPLENYRMTEEEDTKNSGTDTIHMDRGAHTDTISYGERRGQDIMGGATDTGSSTHNVAPFESQSYQNVDKDENSQTYGSRTNQHSQNSVSDSTTIGGHMDIDTTEHGHTIKRKLERYGNVGVTTSQQMLESERQVSYFNFMRIVANDIVHTICVCGRNL